MASPNDKPNTSPNESSDGRASFPGESRDEDVVEDEPVVDISLDANSGSGCENGSLHNSSAESSSGEDSDDSGFFDTTLVLGSKDDLYTQDIPSSPAARVILYDSHRARENCLHWRELRRCVEENASAADVYINSHDEPVCPDSPPWKPIYSAEYKAIDAAASKRAAVFAEAVADAVSSSGTRLAEDFEKTRREGIDPESGRGPSLALKDIDSIGKWAAELTRDMAIESRSDVNNSDTESDTLCDSFLTQLPYLEYVQYYGSEGVQEASDSPPASLIDILNKAERELLSDINDLPFETEAILQKPSVINKYFPKDVFVKLFFWDELMEGYNSIKALERHAMPERQNITVMMAVPDPPQGPTWDSSPEEEDDEGAEPSRPAGTPINNNLTNTHTNGSSNHTGDIMSISDSGPSSSVNSSSAPQQSYRSGRSQAGLARPNSLQSELPEPGPSLRFSSLRRTSSSGLHRVGPSEADSSQINPSQIGSLQTGSLQAVPSQPGRSEQIFSRPPSVGSDPVDSIDSRLGLETPGPLAPQPSPALSNDAGDGEIGNLNSVTSALEIARQRANSAGIIPQSRFGSPTTSERNSPVATQSGDVALQAQRFYPEANSRSPESPSPLSNQVLLSEDEDDNLVHQSPGPEVASAVLAALMNRPEATSSSDSSVSQTSLSQSAPAVNATNPSPLSSEAVPESLLSTRFALSTSGASPTLSTGMTGTLASLNRATPSTVLRPQEVTGSIPLATLQFHTNMLAAESAEMTERDFARREVEEDVSTAAAIVRRVDTSPASDPLIIQAAEAAFQTESAPAMHAEHPEEAGAEAQREIAVRIAYTSQHQRAVAERPRDLADQIDEDAECAPESDLDSPPQRILSVAEARRRLAARLNLPIDVLPTASPGPAHQQSQRASATQPAQFEPSPHHIPSAAVTQTAELVQPQPLRPGQSSAVLHTESADRTASSSRQPETPTMERSISRLLDERETPLIHRTDYTPDVVPVALSPHLARQLTGEAESPYTQTRQDAVVAAEQAVEVTQTVLAREMHAAEQRAALQSGERPRRKSESQLKEEMASDRFRNRFDSVWGKGPDDHRRGSGAGGAVGS